MPKDGCLGGSKEGLDLILVVSFLTAFAPAALCILSILIRLFFKEAQ